MSRVTIESLYSDFTVPRINARQWGMDFEQYKHLADTEIVPRKIVEMIIEECEKDGANYLGAVANEALYIKTYAESLLKQFEEGENDKC